METHYGVLKMEVSAEIGQELMELFNIEKEMMEAEVEELPNNIKRFTINIPEHKGGRIKEFILRSIANLRPENLN
ncbi:MAG: hypothetical protein JWQ09_4048 [Segetibacter sp.]|nr:hypothetical protein [Segetibacter sp.]